MTQWRLCPFLSAFALIAASAQTAAVTRAGENCSYLAAPTTAASQAAEIRKQVYEEALAFAKAVPRAENERRTVDARTLPRRNLIDKEIFQRLEAGRIPAAPLSSDEEFFRRIHLDLTGRIPDAAEIRAFAVDRDPRKRDAAIDRLLASPEFVDKWTVWLGDLLQNSMRATNRNENQAGRNAFHAYLRDAIATGKPWRVIAREVMTATGNNYDEGAGPANFIVRGFAPMGPIQDTYDMVTARSTRIFLGLGYYDCLLCHNGRGHLDAVSAWGSRTTRLEAERMAAHFARMNFVFYPGNDRANFYTGSHTILDKPAGAYGLVTTFGNRPHRTPLEVDGKPQKTLDPVYRDGTPVDGEWRDSFARKVIADPMFARNFVNRVWKAMFNLGLAEPVDDLDPDRLDPAVEPPGGWDYQASYPDLLEDLAQLARTQDYDLRALLRVIAQSTAYQLSSEYGGGGTVSRVSTFAWHLPRRMEAEEVHDAVVKATEVMPSYQVGGWPDRVSWAMQLPEPTEPLRDGRAREFLDSFSRGDRDTSGRSVSGSVLMWLNLMNSPVVNSRVNARTSPYLAGLVKNPSDEAVVGDLFLTFLSRTPSAYERQVALKALARAGSPKYTRASAVEDLAWALINKADFLFSY